MEGIIEYIDINIDMKHIISLYRELNTYDGLGYIECGATSYILEENPIVESILKPFRNVHPHLCPKATGYNFHATNEQKIPPHIDVDKPNYYNLLIPIDGKAKISLFETNEEDLEFRHGLTHWKMRKPGLKSPKIGEHVVDKPTLLDTNTLHNVIPIESPRSILCIRWINVDMNYRDFKEHVECILK